jgi:hypothetical protein
MGALWVPYRRDKHLMKAILKAGLETSVNPSISRDDIDKKVNIIFCHADVQGASMNDNMRYGT